MKLLVLLIAITPVVIQGLDNGLARKPPMGWMSWTRFACNTDCKNYPDECIHERLYREMADVMDKDGYRDAGYEFVSVDDCWSEMERDPQTGKLVNHAERFPSGMKALGDHIHSKNLKYGLYSDMGTATCQGYPGHIDKNGTTYFDIDAQTFAEWGVDYLKVDGCNANTDIFDPYFPKLSQAISAVDRPIVLSCEWPFYQGVYDHKNPDYESITKWCHQFRNFYDVADSWESVLSIVDFYAKNNAKFAQYHGPGHWNDPDMLTIGNFGLSLEQSKAQMAMWAMMSAPLFMSNDLRKITPQEKAILLNKQVIAVDQDEAGHLAKMVVDEKNIQVWVKKLAKENNFAVAYLNKNTLGAGEIVAHSLNKIMESFAVSHKSFNVEDLFGENLEHGQVNLNGNLTLKVVPSGVRMVKLSPA